ncbi:5-methyltetrahydropteroyltriglutamate--homocysteine S-methyltransferase [Corynebacterium sp. 320]|uniref:5-methyltetrahydropteroyltriglutamate-- homocysteine S-methyltransferase n=1 Tax=Corynebacterium TaxID=1716 RepID=UPI00125CB11A|nr:MULTISPECIES: 5-methyltetrahydropteroyltriglutamate--homocysteine S-methyltransferase [Corynebacterium]KAB1503105.1 5-methyltetrahydropteroyltriglutamate--homocysteine S-methyltransferase [Corynebacterium sp. 320]KAB1551043.1 5-methyltetrahydropteroyltriglutamate--homocysteine S-methyltransferase [Corynebacterium sp. 319]KAB3526902.1 5-methyltetrahydropteroyltriglutamate--homocysteine S-methyltransferase [Corynebacterium sp. 250]KAB3538395.1 5-methyltetrahydropteroyltriglutamate--homocystein
MTFHSTIAGVPRIGPDRELKKALETYWRDSSTGRALASTATRLTNDYTDTVLNAGIEAAPYAGRSYYDAILDTSALLGTLPERVLDIEDHANDGLPPFIDRYFAAARGTKTQPASAMTKWFDTNYHYLVPELSASTRIQLEDQAWLEDLRDQVTRAGESVRPVLIGALTYLSLSRTTDESDALDHLEEVFDAYARLLPRIADRGVTWVQFDEPSLVTAIDKAVLDRVRAGYEKLAGIAQDKGLKLLVQTYFGDGNQAIELLSGSGVSAFGVDLVYGGTELPAWTGDELLVAGVVDGRNVWRTDLDAALETLKALKERGPVAVSTSCSLLHVPYSLEREGDLVVRDWLAFGYEKIQEVAVLSRLLRGEETDEDKAAVEAARAAKADRDSSDLTHNSEVRARQDAITDADRTRDDLKVRREAQQKSLNLPPLPTTTIGSFPQTSEIRAARAKHRKGEIDDAAYTQAMRDEVADVIRRQEELGLDVLVHGEPERNDMVQYFSEQLEGYLSTEFAWVQSYGSRCVRPPIIYGDVSRPNPMTVDWYKVAADLTDKPVKGMLTGPVTMLAWSFVRDDQPLGVTADQVALALRDEIDDLVAAGAQIIQVDEPAIRELLPLRKEDQPEYLKWAVGSFRLATSGAANEIQIHTHMCYSEFNELIDTVSDLNADVTSIEAARNGMQVLKALKDEGYELGVGPGVWDIHSPRVPSQEEVDTLVSDALDSVDPSLLWINPDCGLKTRGWEETTSSLKVLVAAALSAREKLDA